ncbi:MAG: phosphate signaling complex protein PhoU [Haloferacaceae archaeon]
MPREKYQERLAQLRTDVVEMATLVLDRYELAIRAYEESDDSLAAEVVDGDDDVNELYLELEGDCIELLALQQPVAADLRFVAASFKILTDLERIADLATNLAGYARDGGGEFRQEVSLGKLADAAGEMVRDAVEAYESGDVDACREVVRRDDELDAACGAASDRVLTALIEGEACEDGTLPGNVLEGVSTALLTIRDVERVGDHAVNVAARTLYMVENDDELIY